MMQMMEPHVIPSVENANEILESAGAGEPRLNVEKHDTTIAGIFYIATKEAWTLPSYADMFFNNEWQQK